MLFGVWTRRTYVLAAAGGGLSGGIREGLRIGSHGIPRLAATVGVRSGHGIGSHGTGCRCIRVLIRPCTLGVDYPGVACSRGCYMHGGMSRICGKLFDRPHIVECRPHGSHEFPFRHTGAPLCCLTSTFSARFLESVRGADGSSIAREVLGIGLVLGFERSV